MRKHLNKLNYEEKMMVYCINKGKIKNLTLNKQYKLTRETKGVHFGSEKPWSGVYIINDSGKEHYYSSKRFIKKEEYRDVLLNILGV